MTYRAVVLMSLGSAMQPTVVMVYSRLASLRGIRPSLVSESLHRIV